MHEELAQQAGRLSKGCEFRACGKTRTLKPSGLAARSISRSPSVAGNPGMGYGDLARRSKLIVVVARYAKLGFGCVVPRREIGIRQRPVGADAVTAAQFQVLRQEAKRGAEPMPRRPADLPQIGTAEGVRADLLDVSIPDRRRAFSIGGVLIRRFRHPDGRLLEAFDCCAAVDFRPRLDDRHTCAGARQAPRNERTGNAGTHNQDIAFLGQRSLFKGSKAPTPNEPARRRRSLAADRSPRPATSASSRSFVSRTIRRF